MRLLLTFIIFILGGFYTFGKESCCEQCCEYLWNCCKKGKGEVQEEFYLKKSEATDSEEIKKLVSSIWYKYKGKDALFFLYKKINGAVNQNLNENGVIKVKKDKNGFSIDGNFIPENDNNTQKWALFEIIYKEEEKETKYLYCSDIESSNLFGIFYSCKQHISISVIACNTSNVIDMSSMFLGCSSLMKLDLSNFNTETVTDMYAMFSRCSSLTNLDLSKFNTTNVTNMLGMFFECSSLTKLNLSKFNTENVKKMPYMFYNCSSLQTVIFNKNLNNKIIQQLEIIGFTEKVKEE